MSWWPVTSFSVASSRTCTTNSGERREESECFNCQALGRMAETCNQYLTKGKQGYVEGRLKNRTYQTQAGETRFTNDINVTDIQFLRQHRDREDSAPEDYEDAGVDLPF